MREPRTQPPNSITLRYHVGEDRILVAINAVSLDARGFWLTRRLAMKFIEAVHPYLHRISPIAGKTPAELRGALTEMEREIAMANTQRAVWRMPTAAFEMVSAAAELAIVLTVSLERVGFRLKFRGRKGGEAEVGCSRAELLRVVQMLEQEAAKAGWRDRPMVATPPADAREVVRRAN